ncbi:MAG: sulfotransferase [Paracoccaceae bacterium]
MFPQPIASLIRLAVITRENGGVDARRMHRLVALMARYLLSEPFRWAERTWVAPRVAEHVIPSDPVFVLGYWRSGTTYLQRLLSCDPQMVTPSLYDCLFADMSAVTRTWLEPTLNAVARTLRLKYSVQRMPLDFGQPSETDVALCIQLCLQSSNWGHIFPRRFNNWMNRCASDPISEEAQNWLDATDTFLRKCSWAADGRRVVLKSPIYTARVPLLLQRYPNARFVYIHRDPISVFHSNRYLWSVILKHFSLQNLTSEEVDATIIQSYRFLLERYLQQRDQVPPSKLTELRYEDLLKNPESEMIRIYSQLDLGPLPDTVRDQFALHNSYHSNVYKKAPTLEALLREEWAFAFREWQM